jgi:hypothetical protein
MLIVIASVLVVGFLALTHFQAAPSHQAIPVKVTENQFYRR